MQNGPFIDDLPIEHGKCHSYMKVQGYISLPGIIHDIQIVDNYRIVALCVPRQSQPPPKKNQINSPILWLMFNTNRFDRLATTSPSNIER